MSWKKHLTKMCIKCPLYSKYVLTLPWEICSDRLRLSRQRQARFYIVAGDNCSPNLGFAPKYDMKYCLTN